MDQDVIRQLPYDVDVEQALLGAILIDNYALERVSTVLKPEHFYDPLHQRLFDAIDRMWAKGHAVTPLTLNLIRRDLQLLFVPPLLGQTMVLVGTYSVIAAVVCLQQMAPIYLVLCPPLLFLVGRLGPAGAGLGILVTLVAMVASMTIGFGPTVSLSGARPYWVAT